MRVRMAFKETGKHFLEQLRLRPQSLETGACHLFKTLRSPQLLILAYGFLYKNRTKKTALKKKLSNSLKMEITQMFINRGMDKRIVVYQ